jgi:non-specific serine/threonine protein kinase
LTKSSRNSSKLVPDYFEKFIKDIAKKVDISATGFEVITQTAVRSCNLQLVHDFLKTPTLSVFYLIMTIRFDATKTKTRIRKLI